MIFNLQEKRIREIEMTTNKKSLKRKFFDFNSFLDKESTKSATTEKKLRTLQDKPNDHDAELKNVIVQLSEGKIQSPQNFLESFKKTVGDGAYNNLQNLFNKSLEMEKETEKQRDERPQSFEANFVEINDNFKVLGRVISGAWNQADSKVFYSKYAGKQCCAMALAFIVKSAVLPPAQWTSDTINQNMIEENALYKTVKLLSEHAKIVIPSPGYINLKNFDVVKNDLRMFDARFLLNYENDPVLYGNLKDDLNQEGYGFTLFEALYLLFEGHSAGILITQSQSFAVISRCNKFYFCNSHSCSINGEPDTNSNGRACVIECDTIGSLCDICRRTTGYENEPFTLDYLDVAVVEISDSD